mmetsp:Transcript_15465/g.26605  ORF Transcript_15465/g.26605 Transcript_15465/m.26605 type:complete len:290 (-) Transcript_15465:624-1493(-)
MLTTGTTRQLGSSLPVLPSIDDLLSSEDFKIMLSSRTAQGFKDHCITSSFEGRASSGNVRHASCRPPSSSAELRLGRSQHSIPTWNLHLLGDSKSASCYVLVPKCFMADSERVLDEYSGVGTSQTISSLPDVSSCGRPSSDTVEAGPWNVRDVRLPATWRMMTDDGSGMIPRSDGRNSLILPVVSGVSRCESTKFSNLETREEPRRVVSSNTVAIATQVVTAPCYFTSAVASAEYSRKVKVAKFIEKKIRTREAAHIRPVKYPARSILAAHRSRQGGRFAKEHSRVLIH